MGKKQNGLMPGWPPFTEFKKEMLELLNYALNEVQKPMQLDIRTVKDSLFNHISKTDTHIAKTETNFKTLKKYLLNHVTDTDKKIDSLKKDVSEVKKEVSEINSKLDNILEKQ